MTMSKRERKTAFDLAIESARVACYEGYNAAAARHTTAVDFDASAYQRLRQINPYEPVETLDQLLEACS